jgi:hypothetical protein
MSKITWQLGHKLHGWWVGFEWQCNNYRCYLALYKMEYWSFTLREEQTKGVWEQGARENYTTWTLHQILKNYQIMEDEMDWACSMYQRGEKYVQSFVWKTWREETTEDLDIDGRIILKWILKKKGCVGMYWTFGFHKVGDFLTTWATISFLRRTLLHGVMIWDGVNVYWTAKDHRRGGHGLLCAYLLWRTEENHKRHQ